MNEFIYAKYMYFDSNYYPYFELFRINKNFKKNVNMTEHYFPI